MTERHWHSKELRRCTRRGHRRAMSYHAKHIQRRTIETHPVKPEGTVCAALPDFSIARGIVMRRRAKKSHGAWFPRWRIAGPMTKGPGRRPKPAWPWGIGVWQFWT